MAKLVYVVKAGDFLGGDVHVNGRVDSQKVKDHPKQKTFSKEEWENLDKGIFDCYAREVDGVFVLYGENDDIW